MSDYLNIRPPSGKRGPATYKAAKGPSGRGSFDNRDRTKPATKKRLNVDKKVKKVSNKVMGLKGQKTPGPAAHNAVGEGNPA